MNIHADKTQENKSQSVSIADSQMKSGGESTFQFADNRPEVVAQRKLQEMANNSLQVSQLRAFRDMANDSEQTKPMAQFKAIAENDSSALIQKKDLNEEELQTKKATIKKEQSLQGSSSIVQLNTSLALGFSDLKNQTYQQDDVLGRRPESGGELARFREVTHSMGPEAMGINQQADPTGAIQPQFTAGIKKAMASASRIKQNLAGFTTPQVQFAYNHKPVLTPQEIVLLKQNNPDYGQIMIGGKIVDKEVTGEDGAEWFAMKDLLVNKDEPGSGPHPQAWEPWKAPISVWELSHQLHNESLFEKTEFEYFDSTYGQTRLSSEQLNQMGVSLNQNDLMSDEELGVVPPESGFAKFTKMIKSWF